jgi:hypothetical protein
LIQGRKSDVAHKSEYSNGFKPRRFLCLLFGRNPLYLSANLSR